MELIPNVQVGKNGISENLIETVKSNFKKYQNVKVVYLKSFTRDKRKIKQSTDEIIAGLGANYTYRILGFTAFIKKWRKPQIKKRKA